MDVFGYKSAAFEPNIDAVRGNKAGQRTEESATGAKYYNVDAAGREYYLPVLMRYRRAADALTTELWLPHPIVSVTSRKTIIETPLTERRGTVKEVINIMDYDITIRGFVINEAANEYPEAGVKALRELYEHNGALYMQNAVTDIFLLGTDKKGSDKVVIKDISFPEHAGVKHVQAYQMMLVSDQPFNLVDLS